jgi:RNA polymerase subunit RPABC4/transcription elongation factor Spt4
MLKKEDAHVEATANETKQSFSNAYVTINDLISSLDVMDGTNESPNIHPSTFVFADSIKQNANNELPNHLKSCLNKDCLYGLPKEAKFCLKCGTAQMPKFCTECGYSFPGMEKFCPDCGNKR